MTAPGRSAPDWFAPARSALGMREPAKSAPKRSKPARSPSPESGAIAGHLAFAGAGTAAMSGGRRMKGEVGIVDEGHG